MMAEVVWPGQLPADGAEENDSHRSMVVMDSEPEHSGLLDKDGNPLYRVKDQIGFVRFGK